MAEIGPSSLLPRSASKAPDVALTATLLLLAGGESRRMGQPKALLPVETTTLIEWLVARLAPTFEQLLVAARHAGQLPHSLRPHLVTDLHLAAGPLAGVEAGLAASTCDVVVAIACDMPQVTPDLLRRLVKAASAEGIDAAVPRVRGQPEPACAAYRRSAAAPIAAALDAGRFKAAHVLDDLRVAWLDGEDPALFVNLNTPEDYRAFIRHLQPVQD